MRMAIFTTPEGTYFAVNPAKVIRVEMTSNPKVSCLIVENGSTPMAAQVVGGLTFTTSHIDQCLLEDYMDEFEADDDLQEAALSADEIAKGRIHDA